MTCSSSFSTVNEGKGREVDSTLNLDIPCSIIPSHQVLKIPKGLQIGEHSFNESLYVSSAILIMFISLL